MELSVRKPPYIIPSYSLTGDLLSFLRCGLQYRYGGLGQLPSTRPVQLWFGQFSHGVLEEAYRRYRSAVDRGGAGAIPDDSELTEIIDLIDRRLGARGLRARNADVRRVGEARARAAVLELGPELFPIISEAEIPLNGTRHLPIDRWPNDLPRRESDRYEMAGVVDVITEIQLDSPTLAANRIVSAIVDALPSALPPRFEVIVDYKGMRRPPLQPMGKALDYWSIYEWQLQTYARLREVQPNARPVIAGALLFLNELSPTWADLSELRRETDKRRTDVTAEPGSSDAQAICTRKRADQAPPTLSFEFRLRRALRVIPVSKDSIAFAAESFDNVVLDIELARARERSSPHILTEWPNNPTDEATCVACDWKTICPAQDGQMPANVPAEA
jgi:hypothetical protein